jgi:hypothetical protein
VGSFEGLQSDLELRLLREDPRDGVDHALAVGQPACQVGELSSGLAARPPRVRGGTGKSRNHTPVVAQLALERGDLLRKVEPFLTGPSPTTHVDQRELLPAEADLRRWVHRGLLGNCSRGSPFSR